MTERMRDCLLLVFARICVSQSKMTSILATSIGVLPDGLREALKRDTADLEVLLRLLDTNAGEQIRLREGDVVRLIADPDVRLIFEGTFGGGREWVVTGKKNNAD